MRRMSSSLGQLSHDEHPDRDNLCTAFDDALEEYFSRYLRYLNMIVISL